MLKTLARVGCVFVLSTTPLVAQTIPQNTRFHGGLALTALTNRPGGLNPNVCAPGVLGMATSQQGSYGINTAEFNINQYGIILTTGAFFASEIIFNPPSYTHATTFAANNTQVGYTSQVAIQYTFPVVSMQFNVFYPGTDGQQCENSFSGNFRITQ